MIGVRGSALICKQFRHLRALPLAALALLLRCPLMCLLPVGVGRVGGDLFSAFAPLLRPLDLVLASMF